MEIVKKLPDPVTVSPEEFWDCLREALADAGIFMHRLGDHVESRAWGYTEANFLNWKGFLEEFRHALEKGASEITFLLKIYDELANHTVGQELVKFEARQRGAKA